MGRGDAVTDHRRNLEMGRQLGAMRLIGFALAVVLRKVSLAMGRAIGWARRGQRNWAQGLPWNARQPHQTLTTVKAMPGGKQEGTA